MLVRTNKHLFLNNMKMTKNISFFKGEFIPFEDLKFKDFQRLRFADLYGHSRSSDICRRTGADVA